MYDGIQFRGHSQEAVEELSRFAGVPVWNGLTDRFHPTQMLADVLTMREHSSKPLDAIVHTYVGDARNNMGNSTLITGALLGMDVRLLAPTGLQPEQSVIATAQALAARSGATVTVTDEGRWRAPRDDHGMGLTLIRNLGSGRVEQSPDGTTVLVTYDRVEEAG